MKNEKQILNLILEYFANIQKNLDKLSTYIEVESGLLAPYEDIFHRQIDILLSAVFLVDNKSFYDEYLEGWYFEVNENLDQIMENGEDSYRNIWMNSFNIVSKENSKYILEMFLQHTPEYYYDDGYPIGQNIYIECCSLYKMLLEQIIELI